MAAGVLRHLEIPRRVADHHRRARPDAELVEELEEHLGRRLRGRFVHRARGVEERAEAGFELALEPGAALRRRDAEQVAGVGKARSVASTPGRSSTRSLNSPRQRRRYASATASKRSRSPPGKTLHRSEEPEADRLALASGGASTGRRTGRRRSRPSCTRRSCRSSPSACRPSRGRRASDLPAEPPRGARAARVGRGTRVVFEVDRSGDVPAAAAAGGADPTKARRRLPRCLSHGAGGACGRRAPARRRRAGRRSRRSVRPCTLAPRADPRLGRSAPASPGRLRRPPDRPRVPPRARAASSSMGAARRTVAARAPLDRFEIQLDGRFRGRERGRRRPPRGASRTRAALVTVPLAPAWRAGERHAVELVYSGRPKVSRRSTLARRLRLGEDAVRRALDRGHRPGRRRRRLVAGEGPPLRRAGRRVLDRAHRAARAGRARQRPPRRRARERRRHGDLALGEPPPDQQLPGVDQRRSLRRARGALPRRGRRARRADDLPRAARAPRARARLVARSAGDPRRLRAEVRRVPVPRRQDRRGRRAVCRAWSTRP